MMERAYIPSFSIVLAIMEEREWREYIRIIRSGEVLYYSAAHQTQYNPERSGAGGI
jgi:hypothetical protein